MTIGITDQGCQLWRTSTGGPDEEDWEKVSLPKNSEEGKFKDGFGEKENYGIRRLVNYSNNLYVGTAADTFQIERPWKDVEATEIWKYDGTTGWNAWECIVGDDSTETEDKWKDGFGDHYNKYSWSMTVCDDELWVGTSNNQVTMELFDLKILNYKTIGCEVWHYDGENLIASVKNGGEIGNGFGEKYMLGARSMIEFPTGSGNLVVGTYTMKSYKPKVKELGCEVWIRDP